MGNDKKINFKGLKQIKNWKLLISNVGENSEKAFLRTLKIARNDWNFLKNDKLLNVN